MSTSVEKGVTGFRTTAIYPLKSEVFKEYDFWEWRVD